MLYKYRPFTIFAAFMCDSPAFSEGYSEQRFGQSQLLLPNSVGQHLSVRIVSVGLVSQLEQLPHSHPKRPETQDKIKYILLVTSCTFHVYISYNPAVTSILLSTVKNLQLYKRLLVY